MAERPHPRNSYRDAESEGRLVFDIKVTYEDGNHDVFLVVAENQLDAVAKLKRRFPINQTIIGIQVQNTTRYTAIVFGTRSMINAYYEQKETA